MIIFYSTGYRACDRVKGLNGYRIFLEELKGRANVFMVCQVLKKSLKRFQCMWGVKSAGTTPKYVSIQKSKSINKELCRKENV